MIKNVDEFIVEELKNIPQFQIIRLPVNDNLIDNLDTAVNECLKITKLLVSKNGKLRQIFKDIKTNKLSKTQTNKEIQKIANTIKTSIANKTDITNPNIKYLINNRINQILKNIIYNMIQL